MATLDVKDHDKLGPRFFGPFKITERIGNVAYQLQLPAGARIHNVFHVGLLKKFHREPPQAIPELPPLHHGRVCMEPEHMLKCCLARGQRELLVRWKGANTADTTWMPLDEFCHVYPTFQLEDELLV
jgi:hypothetical protein